MRNNFEKICAISGGSLTNSLNNIEAIIRQIAEDAYQAGKLDSADELRECQERCDLLEEELERIIEKKLEKTKNSNGSKEFDGITCKHCGTKFIPEDDWNTCPSCLYNTCDYCGSVYRCVWDECPCCHDTGSCSCDSDYIDPERCEHCNFSDECDVAQYVTEDL